VVAVARNGATVSLAAGALDRMGKARLVAEDSLARGETVYGLSTGVGVRKRAGVGVDEQAAFVR